MDKDPLAFMIPMELSHMTLRYFSSTILYIQPMYGKKYQNINMKERHIRKSMSSSNIMKISKQDLFVSIVRVHQYCVLSHLLVKWFQHSCLWLKSWNNFTSKNSRHNTYCTLLQAQDRFLSYWNTLKFFKIMYYI